MRAHFDVNLVYARDTGRGERLVAKYLTHDGQVHVVSDYTGILQGLDGTRLSQSESRLRSLHHSSYYRVQTRNPLAPQVDQEDGSFGATEGTADPQTESFEWRQEGQDPTVLHVSKTGAHTHQGPMAQAKIQEILESARQGRGTLVPQPSPLGKALNEAFRGWTPLRKNINESFDALRELVNQGHLAPHHYDAIRRELYEDEMTPGLGNKKAYRDFIAKGAPGVHVMLDGDGMKAVNDTYGHEAGDGAIRSMGQALRNAIDKTVGATKAKAHRVGGDEFHFHAENIDDAHHVLRQLREVMTGLPPVGGTHNLGFSAGVGISPSHADGALYAAKKEKGVHLAAMGIKDRSPEAASVRVPLRVHDWHPDSPTPTSSSMPGTPHSTAAPGGTPAPTP